MQRRQVLKTLGMGALASTLPSWSMANPVDSDLPTLYGPAVVPSVLLAAAAQRGALPWQVKTWKQVDTLRAGLANGSIAISIVPSYVAANFHNRGQAVGLLNIMTNGMLSIVGYGNDLHDLAGLQKRRLVMPFKNDMPDLVLQALCKRAGIDFSSLNIRYTNTPPQALTMLLLGQADTALLPEPMVTMAQLRAKQFNKTLHRLLDVQTLWESYMGVKGGIPQAGLLVSRDIFNRRPDAIRQLQSDLEQALPWVLQHPQAAAELAGDLVPVPAKALAQAIAHSRLRVDLAVQQQEAIHTFFKVLYELNPAILGGRLPSSDLFLSLS